MSRRQNRWATRRAIDGELWRDAQFHATIAPPLSAFLFQCCLQVLSLFRRLTVKFHVKENVQFLHLE